MRVVLLGYGVRGRVYETYILAHPDEYTLVAIADPNIQTSEHPNVKTFSDWSLAVREDADAAIIALPDRLHLAAAKAALARGMHILLEKPLGCTWAECEELKKAQRAARRIVLTGYVLRFAAYYRTLRDVLRSRAIGDLTSIHHLVAIGYGKSAHAFCRGNWGREADGTSTLVQKCTHDFDLIEWWTGTKKVKKVVSVGSLMHWRPENAPVGAAARCRDCDATVRARCPFDAQRLYVEQRDLRYHFQDGGDAAMQRVVDESPYGRCVYACGNDAVDHQTVLMEYEGGLTVTLEMESYSKTRRRKTHFYGTRGEIVADGDDVICIRPFVGEDRIVAPSSKGGAHGGGDREIMAAFSRLVGRASPERYVAILDSSLESHRIAFMAEESRLRA